MVGKTISHYRILEKLGEGGMGVVYRAEDTRLRRTVALKFLSGTALATEDNKSRFLHEAQAAASLDHPNICGIFEIGEAEGRLFMAMPFIEGSGLDERIAEGPRPVIEILEIAIQTAEALEEAHSKLVIHRDIKPANIMVQQRGRGRLHCVLMDFGLARLSQATKLTREGSQLGTAGYMSPEQVQGSAVDQRSDIWSVGVVLYEMAVGRLPFTAEYEQALFYGILNEQPEPMTALRTGLPMELERITAKCLAKEPDQRYQNCTDLLVDLQALKRTVEGSAERVASRVTPSAVQLAPGEASPPASSATERPSGGSGEVLAAVAGSGARVLSAQPAARRFSSLQLGVVALAAAALAVAATLVFHGKIERAGAPIQYNLRRVTWDGVLTAAPALSADGQLMAYSSDRGGKGNLDLWVQQVDGGSPLQVTNDPADELQATFSPDGTKIAFMRFGQGVLYRAGSGRRPLPGVCKRVFPALCAGWENDRLYSGRQALLFLDQHGYAGGIARQRRVCDREPAFVGARWHPPHRGGKCRQGRARVVGDSTGRFGAEESGRGRDVSAKPAWRCAIPKPGAGAETISCSTTTGNSIVCRSTRRRCV